MSGDFCVILSSGSLVVIFTRGRGIGGVIRCIVGLFFQYSERGRMVLTLPSSSPSSRMSPKGNQLFHRQPLPKLPDSISTEHSFRGKTHQSCFRIPMLHSDV